MIRTVKLTKRFGDLVAVSSLDLDVRAGEIFGFLGPNGAGKTTTIKMLTGLMRPTSGTVFIGGFDIRTHPIEAKSILGYVPDAPVLYEKLTGYEFLQFMADLFRVDPRLRKRRIPELLELLDLQDRSRDPVGSYSRGMRQRLSIAAALVHDPEVLILDEPTVGLDPRSAKTLKDILRTLSARNVTVFMSTHILEIAERMCTRVAIVDQGKMVACGTMEELRTLARQESGTLEDIFLKLTGGTEHAELLKFLAGGQGGSP